MKEPYSLQRSDERVSDESGRPIPLERDAEMGGIQ